MNEKESRRQTSRNQESMELLGYDESLITDVGVIDPESVRIQYPQPKELIIKPRGKRVSLPNTVIMEALRKSNEQ